ncbi:hypothetical protein GCM10023231_38370 [Olivibacter ginsenosidimutans]|uniref:DUF4230 domain-containing protein n=1 Tax=Olivibacter ginsenosidimutans TaxID=1176537 RepID=A0ABP9C8D6_9SPHI
MFRRFVVIFGFFITFGVLLIAAWLAYHKFNPTADHVIREEVMLERIADIGKLELVKYSMKDVIERKELRYFFPDQRVLFIAVGEVTGCIDLKKITEKDIVKQGSNAITIYLPAPEICYVRLDHKRSKIYDISGAWLPGDTQHLVEGVYKLAEQRLLKNAQEMDILGKTKENAEIIFKPMLANITGLEVTIAFR